MCGIAGIFDFRRGEPPSSELLSAMAEAIAHRGPDDEGIRLGPHWGLANRRLAIIGVASGHQPIGNEAGTVRATFNGEIYNHRALRKRLERKGHLFATQTDSEVLVHLYEEHGANMLPLLQGMFAFAVVDSTRRSIILARDRLGQKPLFYHATPAGQLVFASEILSLLKHPGVPRELRLQSLFDYLSLGYVPAPYTIFENVFKLQPACALQVMYGETAPIRPWRYWTPDYGNKQDLSFKDAVARTGELLEKAVVKRMESEVPLGAFLSGGIDSSLVTAYMRKNSTRPVQTFTIAFEDPRYDESAFAAAAASALGVKHQVRTVEPRDTDLLRRIVRHTGEPFCDSSILPTALLSRFAREHVTVALSGDAGDEVFGGYRRYQAMALYAKLSALPRSWLQSGCGFLLALLPRSRQRRTGLDTARRALHALRLPPVQSFASFQEIFSDEGKRSLVEPEADAAALTDYVEEWKRIVESGSARDPVEGFMALDLEAYLPGDLLYKVDIASMMFSLEVRSPFLDHEVVEFVASLPREYKVTRKESKRLLKAVASELLPPEIVQRPKAGFGVPISQWLRHDLGQTVREMTYWKQEWDPDGLFNAEEVKRISEEHLDGYCDHSFELWALLCFKLWHEEVRAKL